MSRASHDSIPPRKPRATAGQGRRGRYHSARGWASGVTAPGADPEESSVLKALAACGDVSGLNCFPSNRTLAARAGVSPSTVNRRLNALAQRGVIKRDTSPPPARYLAIREDRRPVRWAVLMPHSAWDPRALELVNAELDAHGCELITPATRPDIAPAQPRRRPRADKGAAAPQRARRSVRVQRALEPLAAALGTSAVALAAILGASLEGLPAVLDTTPENLPAVLPAALAARGIAPADVDPGHAPAVLEAAPAVRSAPPVLPAPDAAELAAAAFALAFGAHQAPAADVEAPAAAEVSENASPQVITTARGVSQTQDGVSTRPERDVYETHNHVLGVPGGSDDQVLPAPAVGDQPQVVRGARSPADAGAGSKRSRGEATPRRPRKRPTFDVSREAVGIYRSAIPTPIKRHIPEHAVGRVLRAITLELERQGERLGCDAADEVARQVAERAEAWRWRMVDARDPLGVVVGLIVRGPDRAPAVRPWCGMCEGAHPARRWLTLENGSARRCPECHPAVAPPLEGDQAAAARPPSGSPGPDPAAPPAGAV